jgi:exopolysaccharide biosynthesis WecB/TagA/CpsF family protein
MADAISMTASRDAGLLAFRKVPVLNVHVHDVTMNELLTTFDRGLLLTLHTDMLVKLQKDRAFYDALHRFDLVTCDSQILFFALRLMGTPVRERVSGSDFFPRFYMARRNDPSVSIFLCGGAPGVADLAARRINKRAGRRIVVGTDAPGFDYENKPTEVDRIIDRINASEATVLVVGLGGGRQEKFILNHRDRLPHVRMFLPLGGTIDYEAGTLKRPAPWVTNLGLEWLYRVLKEPRQRWRRYFLDDPPALWFLVKQKLGLYRNPFGKG